MYIYDIRRTHTLVETTEELSNLADAILDYALNLARQEIDNKYGAPLRMDDRGQAHQPSSALSLSENSAPMSSTMLRISIYFFFIQTRAQLRQSASVAKSATANTLLNLLRPRRSLWANLPVKELHIASICVCARTVVTERSRAR